MNTQNSRYREIGKVEEWFERHAWIVRNFDLLVALLFLAVGLALVAGHADWDFPWFILAYAIGFIARRWVPRGYLLAMSLLLFALSRDAGEALHRPLYLSSTALAAMWFIRSDRLDLLRRWPSRP